MNKRSWVVGDPVWMSSVALGGTTFSHAAVVTEVDEESVKAKTIRQPFRYETFDHNGEAREFKNSPLPDSWLEERHE
jgi:hypothetical protein